LKINLEDKIREFSPDVVGIESNHTYFWDQVRDLAELIKRVDNKIITVVGGHHASYVTDRSQRRHIDYIIRGEGEFKFLELINSLTKNSPGLTKERDKLPDPAFDLLKPGLYNSRMSHYIKPKANNFFTYVSQRGCSMGCHFCTTPEFFGKEARHLPIEKVREHLEKIKEMGFEEIVFEDDNLLLMPRKYRKEYLKIPQELGLTAFHDAGLYYSEVKQEDIEDLAEAGIYGLFLPVESPNIDTMHKMHKYIGMSKDEQYKQLKKVTKWLNDAGIIFYSAVMVGFPGEGKKNLEEAVEYAKLLKDLGAIAVTFNWVHPYPGTRLYREFYHLVPQERRWETNPEYWNFIKPVFPLKDITLEDAENYINEKFFEINGIRTRNPCYFFKNQE